MFVGLKVLIGSQGQGLKQQHATCQGSPCDCQTTVRPACNSHLLVTLDFTQVEQNSHPADNWHSDSSLGLEPA